MELKDAVAALGALAQETRLTLFRLLVQQGPEGLPAGQVAERLGVPPQTLSFHLQQLAHAGLLTSQRDGRIVRYAVDFAGMERLLAYLVEDCCQGACTPPALVRTVGVRRKNEKNPRRER